MDVLSTFVDVTEFREGGLPVFDTIVRLGLAMILGIMLGFERAQREQSAGMRTYAVVSMASALIMLVSIYGLPTVEGRPQDPGRIAAQVVSGIGFLGAGLIFMKRNVVHGLTTAASLWAASGVGLAVGGGMLLTGTIATLFLLLISGGLRPIKKRLFSQDQVEHRVRLHLAEVNGIVRQVRELAISEPGFTVNHLELDTDIGKKHSVLEIRLKVDEPDDAIDVVKAMEKLAGVQRIVWQFEELAR